MAFTAMLSELYGAFRRKVGADEPPTKAAAEAVVIEGTGFRSIDGRFDALSHTMDQRFDALSQRFDVLNQPFDGLSRAMDKRFDALNRAMDQRSDVLSRAMEQRFGEFGQASGQRFDALNRMITINQRFVDQYFATMDVSLVRLETKKLAEMDAQLVHLKTKLAEMDAQLVRLETKLAAIDVPFVRLETKLAEMDAQLARLDTKTATAFRHLRWGLDIVIALLLVLVTKVILDWAMP